MKHHRKNNQAICKGCSKQFYVPPWQQNAGKDKYCNKECYFKHMSINRVPKERLEKIFETYKQGATWADTLKIHKCSDKTLQKAINMFDASRKVNGETKPIIRRVKGKVERKSRLPEGLEEKMIASYVGSNKSMMGINKEFGRSRGTMESIRKRNGLPVSKWVSPPLTAEHKRKISENHHDVSGKNNPMYGKSPGHGKWVYVDHLGKKVRSTWEYEIALMLFDLGIKHKYESDRIYMRNKTYMPDFYLPDYDLFIEVKGWMNNRSKKTLRQFFKEKPYINLLIISLPRYKAIMGNPKILVTFIERKRKFVMQYRQLELPI